MQTKLKISEPGDMYEQEADRVADEVMRMPESTIQRQMEPEEDDKEMVQTKAISNSITPLQRSSTAPNQAAEVPDTVHEVLRSPGQPLDSATQTSMESRFGHDFSYVRIHTGIQADESARIFNAKAYTLGNHVVFAEGQYRPHAASGQHLLAHELTHTLQQSPSNSLVNSGAGVSGKIQRSPLMIQRTLSTLCFEPGQLFFPINPMLAAAFGIIAHKLIALDYLTNMAALPTDVYFDDSFAGPIDPSYVKFITAKNPRMASWKKVFIAMTSVKRPDMLIDDGIHYEYEEVKPSSVSGITSGIADIALINWYMTTIGLPYHLGISYTPSSIPIGSTTFAGLPFEFSLGAKRFSPGLIVYGICIRTDWLRATAYLAAVALLALIIALFPEISLVPVPAFAENETPPYKNRDKTTKSVD
jgi:Domain of unknown function (DUF4157)